MRLEKIHIVQFFLYEAETIEPGDTSAFFGGNGSGKSSLIDAIQIALFGGNAKYVSLNAKADSGKGKKRSIHAYCLGQYGELPEQRARDQACTYITLVWRNPETGQPVSTGVCIEAGINDPSHNVRGAYVADGVELFLSDHLTRTDSGGQTPRNWAAFREELKRRTARCSDYQDEVIYDTSERFIRAAMTRLSNGKDASSIDLFRRALRFGLRLRFDRHVDETLRYEVLESRPTNIDGFRAVMDQFRRLRMEVDALQQRLDAAKSVEEKYRAAENAYQRAQSWAVIKIDIEDEAAQTAFQQATENFQKIENKSQSLDERLHECLQALKRCETDSSALRMRQTQHASHDQFATLNESLSLHRKGAQEALDRQKDLLKDLHAVLLHAAALPHLSDQAEAINLAAQPLTQVPLIDCDAIRPSVAKASDEVRRAWNTLAPYIRELELRANSLEDDIVTAEENLERAKAGQARLPQGVRKLRSYLENHGINVRPVCEGASVTDSRWQPAIEALLGKWVCSAMIVCEHDEKQAFDLYRSAPHDCNGRLVYTSWLKAHDSPALGTVAALINGDDAVAVSYLRGACKGVECIDHFEQASRSRSALTADGMFAAGATIERRRLPEDFNLLLGASQGRATAALQSRLRDLRGRLSEVQAELKPLQRVSHMLQQVPNFDEFWRSLERAASDRSTAEAQASSLEQTLRGEAGRDYVEIVDRLQLAEQAQSNAQKDVDAAHRAVDEHKTQFLFAESEVARAEKLAFDARARSQAAYELNEHDEDYRAHRWDGLIIEYASDYDRMRSVCEAQLNNRQSESDRADRAANSAATAFCQEFSVQPGGALEDGWETGLPWIREIVQRIEETDLPSYREELHVAEDVAQQTFRADVALTLHEHVRALEVHQQKLNDALKNCPTFSNGERYHFTRALRPQYRPLFEFIERVAKHGPDEDLFGGPGETPEAFHQLLEEKAVLGSGSASSPLDDYREFFEFDIEIRRENVDGNGWKKVGTLSKRIGPGSGGEHSAPLYVIAGAALASAYNLDAQSEAGMHLILIDEAFDRMDARNIAATMQFFEQLGLQLFLACPTEKRPLLTAFIDRYYTIARDPDVNTLSIQRTDISREAQEIARSDMPEFHPELIKAEIEQVRAERAGNTA